MRNLFKILWVFLFVLPLKATVVQIDDLTDMAETADVIAQILVNNSELSFEPDGRLVTLSQADVLQGLKGVQTGEKITIRSVEGVVGQSQYRPGEEAVFFGMRFGDKVVSYGVGLGKFRLIRQKDSSAVVEDFRELLTVKKEMGALYVTEPTARFYPSLENFVTKIEDALDAPWRLVPTGPKPQKRRM